MKNKIHSWQSLLIKSESCVEGLDLELVCLLQRGYRELSTMIPSHYDEIIAMYQHPNIITLDLTVKVARGGCALGESGLGEYSTVVVRPLLGGVQGPIHGPLQFAA